MVSQITNLRIVYSTVYSGADQRKHRSSALLAFVLGICQWPVNSLHKGPVTWKMFPFDDVIMIHRLWQEPAVWCIWNAEQHNWIDAIQISQNEWNYEMFSLIGSIIFHKNELYIHLIFGIIDFAFKIRMWEVCHNTGHLRTPTWIKIIAQVYRLSAVHCQMTRYSQRVQGYVTRYCVSQWNLFWQKNQPIRLCLSNQIRPGREWFLSPLGDFNRLFEGLIGELFKIWHWNVFYFFKWHQSGP